MKRNLIVAILLTAVAGVILTSTSMGGPVVTLGKQVATSRQVSMDDVDHAQWHTLLQKHVNSDGNVNYAAWLKSAADMQALDEYLNHLSTASRTKGASRNAQLAFWINAYNAVTVKGILREYPTSSIRNHTATLLGYNIWKDLQLIVGGKPHSLDAIEHRILRPMNEPRIHFAIVCASRGCPRLLNAAYTSDQLERQLTENAKAFFASSDKFSVDAAGTAVAVSPILDWFAADFGSSPEARMQFIAPFVPAEARSVVLSKGVRIRFLDYDWSLNDQS
jgi:hypothetical protein